MYKIYSIYECWELETTSDSVEHSLDYIEKHIGKTSKEYLIIEHNHEINADIPFARVCSLRDIELLRDKEEKIKKL